jgi:hypothetical protein
MHQLDRLDGHLIGIGLEIGRLNFGRPRIDEIPGDDDIVLLVEQLYLDVRPEGRALLLEIIRLLPPFVIVEVAEEGATLQGDIAILGQPRLLGLIVELVAAFPLFDHFCFEVEPRHFGKTHPGFSPAHLEMEFGERIYFGRICCHITLLLRFE